MRIPFTNIELRAERRPRPGPWDDFWYSRLPFETSSDQDVSEDSALTYSAVWACVKVISEDLASLPLIVYRRNGDKKERAEWNPLYYLLHDAPNEEMSAMSFRECLQMQLLLWGNAYAEIERNQRGLPIALWPLNPARIEPKRDGKNQLYWHYRLQNGESVDFARNEILHIPGMSYNGITGISPIKYHCNAIGVGLAAQETQGSTYRNGGRLSLALSHPAPKAPGKDARAAFRDELQKTYGGSRNAGKILMLWEGMKAEKLSMTMEDMQFLESRKFTRTEICAIFRVPPHLIADLERSTFSNIEEQSLEYVKYTIRPWAVRWEQAINQQLLGGSQLFVAEHKLEGLMRGDLSSRYDAYAVGRQWGWLSVNDIRRLENMDPVESGDGYLQPLNYTELGETPSQPAPADSEPTPQELQQAASAIRRLKLIAGEKTNAGSNG